MSEYNTPMLRNRATGGVGRSDPMNSDDDSRSSAGEELGEELDASVRSERSDVSYSDDVNETTPLVSQPRDANISSGASGRHSVSARPFVDTPVLKSSVETQFAAKESLLWLVAMTIGTKVNVLPLLCLDTEPFKSMVLRLGETMVVINTLEKGDEWSVQFLSARTVGER